MCAKNKNTTRSTLGSFFRKTLSINKWNNFGDINYIIHGGTQLKWDGSDTIYFIDYSGYHDEGFFSTKGYFPIDDFVEFSDRIKLNEEYGNPKKWPLNKIEFSGDINDIIKFAGSEDLISILLAVPHHGGYNEFDLYVSFREMAELISKKLGINISSDEIKHDMLNDDTVSKLNENKINIDLFSTLKESIIKDKLLEEDLKIK
jgi:hypothetical protein